MRVQETITTMENGFDRNISEETDSSDLNPQQIPVPATPPIALCHKILIHNDFHNSKGEPATKLDTPVEKLASSEWNAHPRNLENRAENEASDSLECRVNEIASKLSDMGLLPIQAQRCLTYFPEDSAIPQYSASVDQHILYTLHACHAKKKIDLSSSAVNSILKTIEAITEEAIYLSQPLDNQQQSKLFEDTRNSCEERSTTHDPFMNKNTSTLQRDVLKDDRSELEKVQIPIVSETTSGFRRREVEMSIRSQLEWARLQKENEILRLEVNNSHIRRRKLEEMLNMAISGDRVAVQKEIEYVRAQEKADVYEIQHREVGLRSTITMKDAELNHQHDIINRLQIEIKRLTYMQEVQSANLIEKERENLMIQREGQALAIENATLHSEVKSLRHRLDEEIHRADSSQQYAQTCQYSNNELSTDKRRLHETVLRLEGDAEKLRIEHTKLKQELSSSQDDNRRYSAQVQNLGCDIQKRVTDMASLERQRDELIRKCESLKRTNQSVEKENTSLLQQIKSGADYHKKINQQLVELERSLVTSEHEIATLRTSLTETRNERSVLQKLLEDERMKRKETDEIISSANAKEKASLEQIKSLLKEKASLATKLNEANVRLERSGIRNSSRRNSLLFDGLKEEALKLNAHSPQQKILISVARSEDTCLYETYDGEGSIAEDSDLGGDLLKYLTIDG